MVEVVGEFTGKNIGPTFFWGSKPIDGIWTTTDVILMHACIMLAGFGVGDHCLFVIDMQAASLIGEEPLKVQRFTSRQLNMKVSSGATRNYLARLEANLAQQRLKERIEELHETCCSNETFCQGINKLDQESMTLMTNAEKRCRKINWVAFPFHKEQPCGYAKHRSSALSFGTTKEG